jgi:phosphate acetyltransferase/phosphate butyryltransferase
MTSSVASPAEPHPHLDELIVRAQQRAAKREALPAVGVVFATDRLAIEAAAHMAAAALARPLLLGPREAIVRAAGDARIDVSDIEIVETGARPHDAAGRAADMARDGAVSALMKGSLHTDELMSAVVDRAHGLRGNTRISHAFVFDLPRYPKLLALADCVVNIAPNLRTKQDIVTNALALLRALGIQRPKVAIVAAVETVNPAIAATLDAQALVALAGQGMWPGATVEGPFGFDNAISAEAARTKGITSSVSGDADLLLMPDLNAGNMLYKSFIYIGGGECAGLVLGAKVPVVLTSRADSALARLASVALAVLAMPSGADRPP